MTNLIWSYFHHILNYLFLRLQNVPFLFISNLTCKPQQLVSLLFGVGELQKSSLDPQPEEAPAVAGNNADKSNLPVNGCSKDATCCYSTNNVGLDVFFYEDDDA